MSGASPVPAGRQPVDLEAMARDDQLLDLLASGALPESQEPVIQALCTWRAELSANMPETSLPLPGAQPGRAKANGVRVNGTAVNGAKVKGSKVNAAKVNGAKLDGARPEPARDLTDRRRRNLAHKPRRGRRRAIVAASLIGLSSGLGGVTVAAADAEPGSALWPITKAIFTEAAQDKEAEAEARRALKNARNALDEGRVDDAERYLDEAERKADSTDTGTAEELRNEADAVRDRIDDEDSPSEPKNPSDGGDTSGPLPKPALPTPGDSDDEGSNDGERQERDRGPENDKQDTDLRPQVPAEGEQAETSSLLVDPRILEF